MMRICGYRTGVFLAIAGLIAAVVNCTPVPDVPGVTGPQPPTGLTVTTTTDSPTVFEGTNVSLSAEATGGAAPYSFRWDQNGGPVDVTLTDVTMPTLTTPALTTSGRYVFRVVVTDDAGDTAQTFVEVDVRPIVTGTAPALAIVGEPVALTVDTDAAAGDAAFEWSVMLGSASIADATSPNAMLTTTRGETVRVLLTVTLPGGDVPVSRGETFEIVSIKDLTPRAVIETNLGNITLELDADAAPLHTANLLLYADEGFYDGLIFHRNACSLDPFTGECPPFVLQGGGFRLVDGVPEKIEPTRDPVNSEAPNGLSNGDIYSVALALSGGDADSGTTEFFINLKDNSFLDDQGFTVFAHVVVGMDVVDTIVAGERTDNPILIGEVSFPAEPVIILSVRRE